MADILHIRGRWDAVYGDHNNEKPDCNGTRCGECGCCLHCVGCRCDCTDPDCGCFMYSARVTGPKRAAD